MGHFQTIPARNSQSISTETCALTRGILAEIGPFFPELSRECPMARGTVRKPLNTQRSHEWTTGLHIPCCVLQGVAVG